jgi:hypothetical protein
MPRIAATNTAARMSEGAADFNKGRAERAQGRANSLHRGCSDSLDVQCKSL